ncbi:hypothetical protein B6U96_15005 [Archaeoglobales archaeon ex4484_92]|nr:MAG: hypothetical protein B6U96_15005 [Archaeoglobales archaeon ex4484_92]
MKPLRYKFDDYPPQRPWNIYRLWIRSSADIIKDLWKAYTIFTKYFSSKKTILGMLILRLFHVVSYSLGWISGGRIRDNRDLYDYNSIKPRIVIKRDACFRSSEQLPVDMIIVTNGRMFTSKVVLPAINRLYYKPRRVIIVDDSPEPMLYSITKWVKGDYEFAVELYHFSNKVNISFARNFGVFRANSEFVVFLDDDCVPDRLWLYHLYQTIIKDKRLAGVCGRVLPYRWDLISRYYTFYRILEPPRDLTHITLCNTILRRKLISEIGGFRPPPTYAGEDVDLSFRLIQAGYRLGFSPNAVVYHIYRSSPSNFVKTFYRYGRAIGYLARRFKLTDKYMFEI